MKAFESNTNTNTLNMKKKSLMKHWGEEINNYLYLLF